MPGGDRGRTGWLPVQPARRGHGERRVTAAGPRGAMMFVAFDVLAVAGRDIRRLPWRDRWRELEALLGGGQGPVRITPILEPDLRLHHGRRRRPAGHGRHAPEQPLSVRAAQRRLGEAEVAGLCSAGSRAGGGEVASGRVATVDATCQVVRRPKSRMQTNSPAISPWSSERRSPPGSPRSCARTARSLRTTHRRTR